MYRNKAIPLICKKHMLRIVVLSIFMIYLNNESFSQSDDDVSEASVERDVAIGIIGGANFNSFNFNGVSIGGSIGAYLNYPLSSSLSLQPELKYSMLGGVRRNAVQDFSAIGGNVVSVELFNRNVQLSTVDLPILLKFTPNAFADAAFKPVFTAGGYVAYAFDLTEHQDKLFQFEDGSRVFTSGLLQDVSDFYEEGHWGFIVGLGFEFESEANSYGFDIRYRQGINETSLVGFAPEHFAGSIRTSSISFDVFVRIF